MTKRRPSKRKPKFTAKTADRHVLYELSVQDALSEVRFIDRVYKKANGRPPTTLREDFCGTALLCAEWVKRKPRKAVGIDLDPEVLAWGIEHNLAPIGEPGKRVKLREQDVRAKCPGRFDVSVGLNFSYFIFRTREELRGYFKNVRSSMQRDGIFILDAYGGWEAMEPMEEPRLIEEGFTYTWDQDKIDPINNAIVNYIHFEFRDGSKMRKAFTYEWRMWSLQEIRELLAEAGFSSSTVYWEDADDDGEGSGVFRPRKAVENEAAWVAYIVAQR